jgi:O-acetyl-ADP-ribose deacetylase (regulator of RNase III)
MPELRTLKGDIFRQNVDAIVNPVNCVGTMGNGLAFAFKQRHPKMFAQYAAICARGELRPGKLFCYEVKPGRWIVNLPTKDNWCDERRNPIPSRPEHVRAGIEALVEFARSESLASIAVPALGCGKGGLDLQSIVLPMLHAAARALPRTEIRLVLEDRHLKQAAPVAARIERRSGASRA